MRVTLAPEEAPKALGLGSAAFGAPNAPDRVPGALAYWDKSGPEDRFIGWTYPLSMDTCWAFRRACIADACL